MTIRHAYHVVMEDDAAHPRQLDAASLKRIAGAGHVRFGFNFYLFCRNRLAGVVETAVLPMAVRTEDGGQFAGLALGPIEVAADVMAWHTGKKDLFDCVIIAFDFAVDYWIERRFHGHRP